MATPLAAGSCPPELSPEAAINHFLHSLIRPTRLLVAISGGSDSTGLLVSLSQAIRSGQFAHGLVAATIDHGLRPEAADEAGQVAELCERLGIPHTTLRWNGNKPVTGISEAARLARYRLLAEAAWSFQAEAIVTGHTLDDQAETIAMRAGRSADDALGLAGMAPATLYDQRIWILRPFLQTRRAAIREYLQITGVQWLDDPSNEDPRYERVRIRRSAPSIDLAAVEAAGLRRVLLSQAAAEWLTEGMQVQAGQVAVISLADTGRPPAEVRKHALATLAAILGGKSHRPATRSLARLTAAMDAGTDFRLTLSGTLVLRRRDTVFLVRESRGLLPLTLAPGEHGVWDGRYAIVNETEHEIAIVPGPLQNIPDHLPGPVRSALQAVTPQASGAKAFFAREPSRISILPRLSLYADFMPIFDLPLAGALSHQFGTGAVPTAPFKTY